MALAQIKTSSISVSGVCCWEVLLHVSMCVRVRAMTLRIRVPGTLSLERTPKPQLPDATLCGCNSVHVWEGIFVGAFVKRLDKWKLVLISMLGCGTHSFVTFCKYLEMSKEKNVVYTPPEDSFLGSDISLQLSCSDVDADRLRKVADSLGNNSFGCITWLQPGSLQPYVFTLVVTERYKFCNLQLLLKNKHPHLIY